MYPQGYQQGGSASGAPYVQPSGGGMQPPGGWAAGPPGYAGNYGTPPGQAQSFQQTGPQSFNQGYPMESYPGAQPQMMGQPPMGYDPQSFATQQGQPPMGYDPQSFAGQPQSFAGQPQMGFDPQSFAMQQAEEDLAALEEKKKAKDEAHKQREVEHLTHKLRSGGRDQKDNQASARCLCLWGIFNGLMFGLALTGDSWWRMTWWAGSISDMTVTLGLFNVKVDLQCNENAMDQKLCNAMKPWAEHEGGQWSTTELVETMCKDEHDSSMGHEKACSAANWVYRSGFPPLIFFPGAAGFECLSLLLLYFYWHVKPSSMTRTLSEKCAVLALMCGGFGLVGWMGCGPWLTALPRKWAIMANIDPNGSLSGFKTTFRVPFGWCSVCAFFAIGGTAGRLFSQYNLPFHIDEPDPYGLDESMHLMEESKAEAERTYGT